VRPGALLKTIDAECSSDATFNSRGGNNYFNCMATLLDLHFGHGLSHGLPDRSRWLGLE
jgi:hypothetical protein